MCERCGTGIKNLQTATRLSQRGQHVPQSVIDAGKAYSEFLGTCFSRYDPEERRALIMAAIAGFGTPDWDALTGGR